MLVVSNQTPSSDLMEYVIAERRLQLLSCSQTQSDGVSAHPAAGPSTPT
jgi:hypothetical protein